MKHHGFPQPHCRPRWGWTPAMRSNSFAWQPWGAPFKGIFGGDIWGYPPHTPKIVILCHFCPALHPVFEYLVRKWMNVAVVLICVNICVNRHPFGPKRISRQTCKCEVYGMVQSNESTLIWLRYWGSGFSVSGSKRQIEETCICEDVVVEIQVTRNDCMCHVSSMCMYFAYAGPCCLSTKFVLATSTVGTCNGW